MGDEHDGASEFVEFTEQLQNFGAIGRVEVAGGLVGEDEGGIVDLCAGDGHALALPAAELGGSVG